MHYRILLSLCFVLCFTSCRDDDNPEPSNLDVVSLKFTGQANDGTLILNQEYRDSQDLRMVVSRFQFYISNIRFEGPNGVQEFDEVHLYDLSDPKEIPFELLSGQYDKIVFGLGLDADKNASDPNSFDQDHPLSFAQNTYWGWEPMYKFVMIEGKVDEQVLGSPLFDHAFSFHTGFNDLYREVTLTHSIDSKNEPSLQINISIDDIFYGEQMVDLLIDNQSHSLTPLAEKVTNNLTNAFSIE